MCTNLDAVSMLLGRAPQLVQHGQCQTETRACAQATAAVTSLAMHQIWCSPRTGQMNAHATYQASSAVTSLQEVDVVSMLLGRATELV
jgi:hypothetical protein